jgi:hypothetical protein
MARGKYDEQGGTSGSTFTIDWTGGLGISSLSWCNVVKLVMVAIVFGLNKRQ